MIKVLRNIRERRRYLKMDKSGEIYLIEADHHISRRNLFSDTNKFKILHHAQHYRI